LATISFIPQTKEVAMTVKSPIYPERIRKIPGQFSWLDQRLVSEHYIDRCTHGAAALYLFLVTVADARGLSYYADKTLCRRLAMDESVLVRYRQQLIDLGLIAYRRPLCQVLAIEPVALRQGGSLQCLEQVFKRIGEGLK
jgi:hypothetical protein